MKKGGMAKTVVSISLIFLALGFVAFISQSTSVESQGGTTFSGCEDGCYVPGTTLCVPLSEIGLFVPNCEYNVFVDGNFERTKTANTDGTISFCALGRHTWEFRQRPCISPPPNLCQGIDCPDGTKFCPGQADPDVPGSTSITLTCENTCDPNTGKCSNCEENLKCEPLSVPDWGDY